MATLLDFLPAAPSGAVDGPAPDDVVDAFGAWADDRGLALYPHQEEAILELFAGSNVVLATPTGSGKSMVALAAHALSVCGGGRSWYTAPVKALVSEKFFDLCRELGPENVGLMTGDSTVNAGAPVVCCTTEILAQVALREGRDADASTVILDEFHYYGDPDRGWAWQVPLLELPQSTFLLMSATLGDVRHLADDLARRTSRPTVVVDDAERPVPLRYSYRRTLLHHTVEELLAEGAAPLYLVNFSQRDAVAMATAMASITKLDSDAKAMVAEELAAARLQAGFGRDLGRLLRNGVGVHHAGMLPRYRRLVERLTQSGAIPVVSGTDTLGVGVNLPIRTVVLSRLYKYDGTRTRLLSAREFHQIAGRAGRAGYDTEGLVVALAPNHVAENEAVAAKATEGAKKRKQKKSQPPKDFVHFDEDTFERLVAAPPEPLESSFSMTPGMLLQLLDRPGDVWAHARSLLLDNHEPRSRQRRHVRTAVQLCRAFRAAGVVQVLDHPDDTGRHLRVDEGLQENFALDQPLAPFLLEAVPLVDAEDDGAYATGVLALVEAVAGNPSPVLFAQRNQAKDQAMAEMKADGLDYETRMAELDKINYPQPMRDQIFDVFDRWRTDHPWIGDANIAPKGVVRDMWDRSMDFPSFVRHLGIKRSEGALLRYLSEVYKVLTRTVPESARTEALDELTEWLATIVRSIDSSLVDEWTALSSPGGPVGDDAGGGTGPAGASPAGAVDDDITADPEGFARLIRTQLFRWVVYAATGRWDAWAEDLADAGDRRWNADDLVALFDGYRAEHGDGPSASASPADRDGVERVRVDVGIDGDARSSARVDLTVSPGTWTAAQGLADPAGHDDWYLAASVDVAASATAGAVQLRLDGVRRR